MDKVILPVEEHLHTLPDPYAYPDKTLAKCLSCDKWFFRGEQYVGFGFNKVWWSVS